MPAVVDATESPADPALAVAAALRNRVGPLLWRALRDADRAGWLGDLAEPLRREFDIRRVQAAVLLPLALERALHPLAEAGMEPVVFKGPAVAVRYPEPGLRPMDDIDVLLPATQHDRALDVLRRAGWRALSRPGDHYDTILVHGDVPGLPLELHRALSTWRERVTGLTSDALWASRIPTNLLGTRAYGVRPEEDLVALACHAGKPFHNFERLVWWADLAAVIDDAGPAFDWDRVARLAEEVGASTVVAICLRQARRLGADVPPELGALPRSRLRRAAIAPVLDETWPVVEPDLATIQRLRYLAWDRRRTSVLLAVAEVTDGPALEIPGKTVALVRAAARSLLEWRRSGTLPPSPDGAVSRARGAGIPTGSR